MFCEDNYPRNSSPQNGRSYQMKEPWVPEVASVRFKIRGLSLTCWHQPRHNCLKSCKQGNSSPGRDCITAPSAAETFELPEQGIRDLM